MYPILYAIRRVHPRRFGGSTLTTREHHVSRARVCSRSADSRIGANTVMLQLLRQRLDHPEREGLHVPAGADKAAPASPAGCASSSQLRRARCCNISQYIASISWTCRLQREALLEAPPCRVSHPRPQSARLRMSVLKAADSGPTFPHTHQWRGSRRRRPLPGFRRPCVATTGTPAAMAPRIVYGKPSMVRRQCEQVHSAQQLADLRRRPAPTNSTRPATPSSVARRRASGSTGPTPITSSRQALELHIESALLCRSTL